VSENGVKHERNRAKTTTNHIRHSENNSSALSSHRNMDLLFHIVCFAWQICFIALNYGPAKSNPSPTSDFRFAIGTRLLHLSHLQQPRGFLL